MLTEIPSKTHEKVVRIDNAETGLRALIAIHSTALGPAAGGCRLWSYDNDEAALVDALNLSRGMTYKNALAGVGLGGGKSVIMGPIEDARREDAFLAFGAAVDQLGGAYVTAEDVGVNVADMEIVARKTAHVSGLKDRGEGVGGDPSPYTALGVLRGIEAAAGHAFGRDDLDGLTVAVQGLGSVGEKLCKLLGEQGAALRVTDVDVDRVERVCDLYGAEPTYIETVLTEDADIVAPCALGGAITEDVARKMKARVVAGAANNQIATPAAGAMLQARGITYAPDYVVNAGGIIMAAAEFRGGLNEDDVRARVDLIYDRTADILDRAANDRSAPGLVADRLAEDVIARGRAAA